MIWINGDKGYKGLAKVGEEFTKKTGIKVVVERGRCAEQIPAGSGRRRGGHLDLAT